MCRATAFTGETECSKTNGGRILAIEEPAWHYCQIGSAFSQVINWNRKEHAVQCA